MESPSGRYGFPSLTLDSLLQIAVIGDTGVGKSNCETLALYSLQTRILTRIALVLSKFARNEFVQAYVPTIGIDFAPKVVTLDDKNIRLNIWDTC